MEQFNLTLFVMQIVIIISLFVIIIYLLRYYKALQLEKRVNRYTVEPPIKREVSFFDKVHTYYLKLEFSLAKKLSKLHIFDTYSKKYEKYISHSSNKDKTGMNYIAMKVIYGVIVFVIVIASDVLQYKNITGFQILYSVLIGFFIPDVYLASLEVYRKKRIENDLLRAITMMNNAFQSGKSTMQAIELVSHELDGPLQEEFRKMYVDLSFGLSLEAVFERFAKRVDVPEVKYITTSLIILNSTGGNIVKVFSSIERSFFNRKKLQDELKALTASASAIYKILIAIPIFIFLIIVLLNQDYIAPLVSSPLGFMVLGLILLIYILYIFVIHKIMKIDI